MLRCALDAHPLAVPRSRMDAACDVKPPASQPDPSTPDRALSVPSDRRNGNNRGLTQAYALRDLAANTAMALRDELLQPDGKLLIKRDEYGKPVDAPAIAQLIRAWSEAREAIRILRGRPLPGSLRPEKRTSKRSVAQSATPIVAMPANANEA